MKITETKNDLPKTKPIKEIMSVFIPNINPNLPNRNGAIYAIIGSPGSGKTNLLFSTLFKNKITTVLSLTIYFSSLLKVLF